MNKRSFVLGTIFGAAVAALLHFFFLRPPFPFGGPPHPAQMEKFFMRRIARDLSLTPKQQELVEPILRRVHIRIMESRLANEESIDSLMSEARQELATILDADQQARLAEIGSRHKRERDEMEKYVRQHQVNSTALESK